MSSSPLDCWLTPPTNRQARRRRRAAPQISKMNVERLEAREVPAIFAPSDISGRVFEDCNLNGVLDAGEEPIAGVTITLTGTDAFHHAVTTVVTTGAEGAFSFTKLEPGQYTITETQPSDFFNGKTIVGTIAGQPASENGTAGSDAVSGIVLEGGDAHGSGYNFTEYAKNTLSGTVFLDLNDNGQQDAGEGGITGATLILSGTDDLGVSANQTVTSAADGTYSFASLRPGAYSITETNPAGILDGPAIPGTVDGKITGTVADAHHIVNITEDGCHSGVGFNFTGKKNQPPTNSISGFVYGDCNNNGVFDAGEMGIAGVAIELTGVTSTGQDVGVFAATTNTDGKYEFDHLPAGTYRISETQPAAFFDGKETLGAPFRGTVGNDVFSDVVIPTSPSQAGANYNFGELQPSTLAGTVFLDANANGTQDAGETGVTGVTLFLAGTNDLGQMIFTSTTSGADGAYQFMPLRPGHYTIIEVQPPNLLSTKNTVGTAGGLVLGDVFANVDLMACTSAAGYNYGEQPCTSPPAVTHKLSGFVFEDCNFNGAFDAGEEPIANVVVILTGTDISGNAVSIRAATDGSGQYQFVNLAAGHYTVTEVQPAGFLDNKESVGTPFGGIADTKIGDDFISNIVIPDSMTPLSGVNYNFGEVGASISGQIYEDLNNNGVRDAGENLIAEPVTVTLTGTDDTGVAVSISTVPTSGTYLFDKLRPGSYNLAEAQPDGFLQGKNAVGTPLGGQLQDVDQIVGISVDGCHAGAGYNFGECPPASVSGFVYLDTGTPTGTTITAGYNDGILQNTEEQIAGATITLTGTDNMGQSVSLTTTTGLVTGRGAGYYEFKGLSPGTYSIHESNSGKLPLPDGRVLIDGKDTPGTPAGSVSTVNDLISNVVLPCGFNGVNNNFGELAPSNVADIVPTSIGGMVWFDINCNGVQNTGERGIAGVSIVLTGNEFNPNTNLFENVTLTTTTDANGNYTFSQLFQGTYTIHEVQPAGFQQGATLPGTPFGGGVVAVDTVGNISVPRFDTDTLNGLSPPLGVNYNFGECKSATKRNFLASSRVQLTMP